MKINEILVRPILTEKATNLSKTQTYMFEVHKEATKFQVAEALKMLYKVKVGAVRIMVKKGKNRRVGRRMVAKVMPNRKIAFVTVTEGKIDLFPQT